ncbi:MAG: NADH-quinone oxidoreductase subunit M [Nitrospirota bacterium]|jgi:NADH-quinone oxidoreductase subunit M
MNSVGYPILTIVIFLPVVGAAAILLLKRSSETRIKSTALVFSIATFLAALPLFTHFDKTTHEMQFVESHAWISAMNVYYALGVDGLSVLFVLLSAVITITCVMVSWNAITKHTKEFYSSLLLIEAAMIGVFCSLDFFLFYIFWEAMLIPMFLLIGVWGGPRRIYSAIKFFLYTLVGSVLMLVGIIVLHWYSGGTFDIRELSRMNFPYGMQLWLFWAFFAAFAVKVPMFPVHTWLPDAHTEAPTAGSVILAGILIKMGAYGFLRFSLPLFPDAALAMTPIMIVLSIIAIIYGGIVCLAQTDLKRLIAYSSVSHMGFVTLGIFALNIQGVEGGILQMINHGVVTGALFLAVGMIYERTHTREIKDYGGVATVLPVYAGLFMVLTLASIGLPGLNGFIGEFLIILGGFTYSGWAGALAATGIIIGAAYMLWLYQRIFFVDTNPKVEGLGDLDLREILTLAPMVVLIFWIGVYPNAFLSFMHPTVAHLLERVHGEPVSVAQTFLGLIR